MFFVKNRCGNDKLWATIIRDIILPFHDDLKKNRGLKATDPMFSSSDGEEAILRNVMKFKEQFRERNIFVIKHCASLSPTSNACDAKNLHKAPKKTLKHMQLKNAVFGKEHIVEEVNKCMEEINDLRFPGDSTKWPKSERDKICNSVVKISAAFQKCLTSNIITDSFKPAGPQKA